MSLYLRLFGLVLAALAAPVCVSIGLFAFDSAGLLWCLAPLLLVVPGVALAIHAGLRPARHYAGILNTLEKIPDLLAHAPVELVPFLVEVNAGRERLVTIRTREQGYFSALSHEFRNCLAVIQARADCLDCDEAIHFTNDIQRLSRLMSQLMVKARLRIRDLKLEPVNLGSLLRRIAVDMVPTANRHGCAIGYDGPDTMISILANESLLEEALRNLMLNAIEHTRQGTEVEIGLSSDGVVSVRDFGPGVPEQNMHDIFEPFWKERNMKNNGAGLGLTIARDATLLHNGQLEVKNHDESGAVFTLRLPVISEVSEAGLDKTSARVPRFGRRVRSPAVNDLVELSDDIIFAQDRDGKVTSWNRAASKILGYETAEIVGHEVSVLIPRDRSTDYLLIHARVRQGEIVDRFETRMRAKDGADVPVLMTVNSLRDGNGNITGATSVLRDISDRKQSEKALREQVRLLMAITDNAAEAMFMSDAGNRITFMNRAAEKLSGWSFSEIRGKRLHDTIHHHRADGAPIPFEECPLLEIYMTKEPLTEFEDVMIHRDGTVLDVSYSNAPIMKGDEITGSVLIVHDISERKKAEATLQQAQKMRAIGNLTGGMAHDFNNLLGVIVANLDMLLQMKTNDQDVGELAGNALEAALSGSDLTRRLLAFARRQSLSPERVNVNDLIHNTIKLLSRTLGKDIEIELGLSDDIWPITVDPAQLEAALTNLAGNARDAMPTGGRLVFRTSNQVLDEVYASENLEVVPGSYVLIDVSDTGTGMPAEIISQIFEPFFSTKDSGSGTGLGLSMVFGFMKQSGGHIGISSVVGSGSSFRLYFPRTDLPMVQPVRDPVPEPLPAGNGETILAVEDNPALRQVLVKQLAMAGYRTLEAGNGATAMAILDTEAVDLVITDIVMPGGISGFDLAERIASQWPDVKIIMASGFPELNLTYPVSDTGKVKLLMKPYRRLELETAIRTLLSP